MIEQDEWRPFEDQPEPSLPVSPKAGTYHRGLQNTMEPSWATGQRGKVATISILAQQARRPVKIRGSGDAPLRPSLGIINVIFASPGRPGSHPFRVMSVARHSAEDGNPKPKRDRVEVWPLLSFSDKDMIGTIQKHYDALVVTLRIGGYDVKRVMVD